MQQRRKKQPGRRALLAAASPTLGTTLAGAEATMCLLAGFLEDEAGYQVEMLTGAGATPDAAEQRIKDWLLAGCRRGDHLVFAAGAHGAISNSRDCFGLPGGVVYLDRLEPLWRAGLVDGATLYCLYDLCRVTGADPKLLKKYEWYFKHSGGNRPLNPLYRSTLPRNWIEFHGCQVTGSCFYESPPPAGNLGDFTTALVASARHFRSAWETVQQAYQNLPNRGAANLQLPEVVGPEILRDRPMFGG